MNLQYAEMKEYSYQLIDTVYDLGGEITLLWHNQSLMRGDIHRNLYVEILHYIANKSVRNN